MSKCYACEKSGTRFTGCVRHLLFGKSIRPAYCGIVLFPDFWTYNSGGVSVGEIQGNKRGSDQTLAY